MTDDLPLAIRAALPDEAIGRACDAHEVAWKDPDQNQSAIAAMRDVLVAAIVPVFRHREQELLNEIAELRAKISEAQQ